MTEWCLVAVGDVIDIFDAHRVPLSSAQRAARKGPYPYYGAQGVIDHIDDFIFEGRYILVPEDGENLRSRKLPIAYFANGQFWVNNHAHIIKARSNIANDRFIQSALEASDIGPYVTGAAQPKLSQANLRQIQIALPSLGEQAVIGGVLDALDDLIENNRRQIELLEQVAQAIYREWFVRFRYPGHENAAFADSPLGRIPEDWKITSIAGVSGALVRGIPPQYSDNGRWVVVNQRCIREGRLTLDLARRQDRDVPALKQVRFGDVLVNSTGVGTLGRVGVALEEHANLTVDSHVTIVRPSDTSMQPWFGLHMKHRQHELEALGVGTTGQTELGRHIIGRLPVLLPPATLLAQFAATGRPIVAVAPHLMQQNRNLANIRDLLLPKLVTGQIDVSELDLDGVMESV